MASVFHSGDVHVLMNRITNLNPDSQPRWGKMQVGEMLAHLNVMYEMTFEPEKYPKPGGIMKYFLRWFVKPKVTNDEPYKRNMPTAKSFKIAHKTDFEAERTRLLKYLQRVLELGDSHFQNKESHSFGKLTAGEWNNMFYKHLDHHLSQFGV